jgi:hypothetical protein
MNSQKSSSFPFSGLEFFQCSSNETLFKLLERESKRIARLQACNYTFYSMTCYISETAISDIASLLNKELGEKLSGFNILLDQDEFAKQGVKLDDLIDLVLSKTSLSKNFINILPVNMTGGLFHAKAYSLLPNDFEVFDYHLEVEREFYESNSYLKRNYRVCMPYDRQMRRANFKKREQDQELKDPVYLRTIPCISKGILIVTSGNFTNRGMNNNFEIGYYSGLRNSLFFEG